MLDQASPNVLALTAVLILAGVYLFRPTKTVFPTINKYPGDFRNQRAHREVQDNARKLVIEGLARHKGPVSLNIPFGRKILLPASLADWVKSNKDLDHRKLVKDDFFADIPGFDAQTLLHSSDSTVLNVIKTKLGQNNSTMGVMHESIAKGLEEIWGDEREWHNINWYSDTMELIARAASSVFVGPEKAADREWLDLVQGYVMAYFTAVSELHQYPVWSRSIVHWFLPNAVTCRKHVAQARILMRDVVAKRHEETRKAELGGEEPPTYNDALFWIEAASGGKIEPGDAQLSLAMAAMFTTTELFRQLLIDIARDPEITVKLRAEVSQQISAHGVSVAATSNMVLLDSVMKESQRLSSSAVVLERAALKDTILPDGSVVPCGSHIMVDSTDLWNSAAYPNADQFDGRRFLQKREAGDKSSQFVQSGGDYHVFGGGRHICPGRFFATNELKLTLAQILLKYDIQLVEGCNPKVVQSGLYTIVDPTVQLKVRRRETIDTLYT